MHSYDMCWFVVVAVFVILFTPIWNFINSVIFDDIETGISKKQHKILSKYTHKQNEVYQQNHMKLSWNKVSSIQCVCANLCCSWIFCAAKKEEKTIETK